MQESLLVAYLEIEKEKINEDKENNSKEGQNANESDARNWIRKYQLELNGNTKTN